MQAKDEFFMQFHELIQIEKTHVSKNTAIAYVNGLAECVGIPAPESKTGYKQDFVVNMGGKDFAFNFHSAVRDVQETGVSKNLQFLFDSRDNYLGPVMDIAITQMPKGLSAKISGTVGQFKKEIQAPGSIESPENSLADDILFFRRAMTDANLCQNLTDFTRFYRAYLQSCISLVDCFLFRYAAKVASLIESMEDYSNTATLASRSGIESRIQAWMQTFAYHELENYKATGEWSQFQELRKQRNLFVHPVEPVAAYQLKDIVKYLNHCRNGIGELLAKFREYSGTDTRIGFIQKVRTAPKISLKKS